MADYAQRLLESHTAIQIYVIAKDLELDSWREAKHDEY